MNEELWKNKEYVDLINKAFAKIDKGLDSKFKWRGKTETLSSTFANRAKASLLAQPDLLFLPHLKKFINDDAGTLAFKLKQLEDQTLRGFQFVGGMEGHHYLHQNVMQ